MVTTADTMTCLPAWGTQIVVDDASGVPFRMYEQRPRHLREILCFAARWSERVHLIQGSREFSFGAVARAIHTKVQELARSGLRPGDRVLVLGWNSPEYVVNTWSCIALGAVPLMANPWWSEVEVAGAVELLAPAAALADERGRPKLPAGVRAARWDVDWSGGCDDRERPFPDHGGDENDPAAVVFTSGTSGRPKAAVLAHRSYLANLQMLLHISRRLPQDLTDESGEVVLHTIPLFHIGGIQMLLRSMVLGNTVVLPEGRFDAGEVLALIEKHRVSRWAAVPTMIMRAIEHPNARDRDLTSLRSATLGGAPIHSELLGRLREVFPGLKGGAPTGYGLTENGGQATAASARDTLSRPGTAGRALPLVELSFREDSELPDDEILVRSPTQMLGYLGDVESPIDAAGWVHTGDLGHLDDDEFLWITGRSKDLIIRGGENIAPAAVEKALLALDGVREAAVVGVPHPEFGEEVFAFVVTIEAELTDADLKERLRGRLASFAIPTRWEIANLPLPTNQTGKIDKPRLAEMARALVDEASP
jgi:acyl-CoA synthetase (AMP-forming)/AMP-acid ligase II